MQVLFVGGAQGVGASCVAIEIAQRWIVVDGGVRVDRKSDPLPDLALLQDKAVQAIFVTHAHADHIGALPLLHQAFPLAPIFTSRATSLLMEVMLADAVKIMARRAVEEMELPLYPEHLISAMLMRVRTLPVGEDFHIGELPGVKIHASRAGHIAGAVSLGFEADNESIVVSGDISITPQRTVLGAVAPPVKRPDLLVLESTYGARLHPNRQAEELRLAQAVVEGLARGGPVLIPSFGLGRGQEIILILRAAQEKGQVPPFPIYVDGLVRRVCSTYMLLPEALPPQLQRQIRNGYAPFTGGEINFVRDERDRERIIAGPPACIVTSSGMLTGGPSAWYAARIAGRPEASIFITGYQDEEAPGRRLLDLAEKKASTLEVGGVTVTVNCQVAKYSLSAHADGSELAAYASSMQPKQVALVHGDDESRAALRTLLTNTSIILPANGELIEVRARGAVKARVAPQPVSVIPALPIGLHPEIPFTIDELETLWEVIRTQPDMRMVTARELAQVWYGMDPGEEQLKTVLQVLQEDWDQRYFVRQHALDEAFRVRGQALEDPGDVLQDLVGKVLLLHITRESSKPVLCRSVESGGWLRVTLPRGIRLERTRFPLSYIVEVLGPFEDTEAYSGQTPPQALMELIKAGRRVLRDISAYSLARACEEDATYTLGDLCALAGLAGQSLPERLAIAKLIDNHPQLFIQRYSVMDNEGLALYALSPDWKEALQIPEKRELPNQHEILLTIERAIGSPPQLYRRSVNPETGDVVLSFHFPAIAEQEYGDALNQAAEEAGVEISISPNAHQGALSTMARLALNEVGFEVRGAPSFYFEYQQMMVRAIVPSELREQKDDLLKQAQAWFEQRTGWTLSAELVVESPPLPITPSVVPEPAPTSGARTNMMNQTGVLNLAQVTLGSLPHCYKVGVDHTARTILVRFHFPEVAVQRYAEKIRQLELVTGWKVVIHPQVHQGALDDLARHIVAAYQGAVSKVSLFPTSKQVQAVLTTPMGKEQIARAQQQFLEESGWALTILAVNG
ncbi:MBL fold metallo-hydrolase [Tengunoibacter tsumagoiensis]|uniref:MBL fold hydrolase n=1 Tax=Tengunoibacter tsumagoiensis TaxID=2014871 RepID=A0A402A7B3_9CHLR|nr:MBL fold metallo-hydrolase [Tengunoibacter tsumagoiensis]GCE14935.1 hypothetical protein KTT_47940 [Tengunoibacter tsumagoiensis]